MCFREGLPWAAGFVSPSQAFGAGCSQKWVMTALTLSVNVCGSINQVASCRNTETEREKMLATEELEEAAFKWVFHTSVCKKSLCGALAKPSADFSSPYSRSSAQERSAPSRWCCSLTVPSYCLTRGLLSVSKAWASGRFHKFRSRNHILCGNTDVLCDLQEIRAVNLSTSILGPHLGQPKLKVYRWEMAPRGTEWRGESL